MSAQAATNIQQAINAIVREIASKAAKEAAQWALSQNPRG